MSMKQKQPKLGLYTATKEMNAFSPLVYSSQARQSVPVRIVPGDLIWIYETYFHHGIPMARVQVKKNILALYCFDVNSRMDYIPHDVNDNDQSST